MPWLPIEVKTSETDVSPSITAFMKQLPLSFALQLVNKPGTWNWVEFPRYRVLVADVGEVMGYFC
jgi:hypothetical protein